MIAHKFWLRADQGRNLPNRKRSVILPLPHAKAQSRKENDVFCILILAALRLGVRTILLSLILVPAPWREMLFFQ